MNKATLLLALLAGQPLCAQITSISTTGTPSPQLSGYGTPSTLYTCDAAFGNLSYLQLDATNGRLWLCDQTGPSSAWQWDHLISPVAIATTGPIGSTNLLSGSCASTTVAIPGASPTTNSATASPIGMPTSTAATAGLVNVTAYVSAANTVTVSVCSLGALTTASVSYKVLMF